ncbi:MAG TPA: hypothetical protein VLL52_13400, partial [Anaerolineae bacterium]|nr:hypothetical protein [Anaerolineae bacterium]
MNTTTLGNLSFLIALLLITAFLFQVDFIYYLIYILIGLIIWSFWFTRHLRHRLHLHRDYHDHAFHGQKHPINLTIHNKSWFSAPWLLVQEDVALPLRLGPPLKHALALPGHDTITLTYHMQAQRRGYYQIGPAFLDFGDLFNLRSGRIQLPPSYLTV